MNQGNSRRILQAMIEDLQATAAALHGQGDTRKGNQLRGEFYGTLRSTTGMLNAAPSKTAEMSSTRDFLLTSIGNIPVPAYRGFLASVDDAIAQAKITGEVGKKIAKLQEQLHEPLKDAAPATASPMPRRPTLPQGGDAGLGDHPPLPQHGSIPIRHLPEQVNGR